MGRPHPREYRRSLWRLPWAGGPRNDRSCSGGGVAPGRSLTASVALAADCPSLPVTIGKVVAGGASCYGGQLLTFRAFVPRLGDLGGTSAYEIRPVWLDDWSGSWVLLSAGPKADQIVAFVPPALGHCYGPEGSTCPFRSYRGGWATVSAHFDGPVAQTCRYAAGHPPGPGFAKADAVAECRAKLIVLSVGPGDLPATDSLVADEPVASESPASLATAFWPGSWEAIVEGTADPDLSGRRLSLTIPNDCGAAQCGEFSVREPNGVGCVYGVEYQQDESSPADTFVVRLSDNSTWGCRQEGAWDGQSLHIRPVSDGSLTVGRGEGSDACCDVTFTLERVDAVYSPPAIGGRIDDTRVVPGQRVTVHTTGFAPGSAIRISLIDDAHEFPVWLTALGGATPDASGLAATVVRIPRTAVAGRAAIAIDGIGFNSTECEEYCLAVRLVVLGRTSPTLPSTDTARGSSDSPPARGWPPVLIVLVAAWVFTHAARGARVRPRPAGRGPHR